MSIRFSALSSPASIESCSSSFAITGSFVHCCGELEFRTDGYVKGATPFLPAFFLGASVGAVPPKQRRVGFDSRPLQLPCSMPSVRDLPIGVSSPNYPSPLSKTVYNSLCFCHSAKPVSPVRPNAHPGRTTSPTHDPIAPPYPEKSVTLPRHPFSALPHPTPRTTHRSPRLRHFSPPIRPNPAISPALWKYTDIRAIIAHARNRPRGPKILPSIGVSPGHP